MHCPVCGYDISKENDSKSLPSPIPRTIREIDTSSWEGKLLITAIARLSCEGRYTSMMPDEILEILNQVTLIVYAKELQK